MQQRKSHIASSFDYFTRCLQHCLRMPAVEQQAVHVTEVMSTHIGHKTAGGKVSSTCFAFFWPNANRAPGPFLVDSAASSVASCASALSLRVPPNALLCSEIGDFQVCP